MSKALTAKMIYDLDHMNVASQRAGGLGTILTGGITPPSSSTGIFSAVAEVKYTTAPLVDDLVSVHAALTLTGLAQPGVITGITSPDVPRTVSITTSANQVGNVVVHGTDYAGNVVSDTIAEGNATTTNGVVAFATITSIDFPARSAPGDTVSLGRGVKIGLPVALNDAALLLAHDFNGTNDAGSFTASATLSLCVWSVAGTMNGVKKLDLYFVS
jgi:hypothetical protein